MLGSAATERIAEINPQRIYIALSGGVDSVVLLHLAHATFGSDLLAALHVNHGLHDRSAEWQNFCADICAALGVEFISRSVTVEPGGSLEANARQARYKAFAEVIGSDDVLLLAHHRDDQVETALQSLFRGTERFGVGGMPFERAVGQGHLLRPLLERTRMELLDYAREHGLRWIDDPANEDQTHSRNYLRHTLLPAIESVWPGARSALIGAVRRDEEGRQLIDFMAENDLLAVREGAGLRVSELAALPALRRSNLVRFWLDRMGLPQPGREALATGLKDTLAADEDRSPLLAWGAVGLRRHDGAIYVVSLDDADAAFGSGAEEFLPSVNVSGGVFEYRVADAGLLQREGYVLKGRSPDMVVCLRHRRSIKKVMQEMRIPVWLRQRVPIVCDGDEVVAIPGLPAWGVNMVVADGYLAEPGAGGLKLTFEVPGQPYSD